MHYILTPHVLQDQALGLEAFPLAIVLLATSILNEVCRLHGIRRRPAHLRRTLYRDHGDGDQGVPPASTRLVPRSATLASMVTRAARGRVQPVGLVRCADEREMA